MTNMKKANVLMPLAMMLLAVFTLFSCGGKKEKTDLTITAADKTVKGAMRDYFEVQSTSCKVNDGKELAYILVELKRTAEPFDFDVDEAKKEKLVGFGLELLDANGTVVGTQNPDDYVSSFSTDGNTDQSSQIAQALALSEGETVTILIPVPVTENVAKFRVTSILKDAPEKESSDSDIDSVVDEASKSIDEAKEDLNNDEDIKKAKKAMKQTKELLDASSDLIDAMQ